MQVEPKNNYNVIGKMGPLQPRPEYRPKSFPDGEGQKAGESKNSGGEKTRRDPERLEQRKVSAAASTGEKLSLQAAKALTEATSDAIMDLDPRARKGPHSALGPEAGLMYPRYV